MQCILEKASLWRKLKFSASTVTFIILRWHKKKYVKINWNIELNKEIKVWHQPEKTSAHCCGYRTDENKDGKAELLPAL